MFRYLCLAWDTSDPTRALVARRLSDDLQGLAGWQCALRRPGLHVFLTNDGPKANDVYSLGGDQGLIVGKLFRRRRADSGSDVSATQLSDTDTERIVHHRGVPLVEDYWGRYVAFLPGEAPGSLRILRDPSGALPCHLLQHQGVWLVFSWLEDALRLLPFNHHPRPDAEGVRAFLLLGGLTGSRTAVTGVEQVLPGERVDIQRDRIDRLLLWNPTQLARSPSSLPDAEAAAALRDTIRNCVRLWATAYERIVLRLSGGVDSSILASCLAATYTPAEVLCLNYRSTDPGADERRYARLAARAAMRPLQEMEVETGVRLDRLLALPRTSAPRSHINALSMARLDASVAADFRASAIFSGVGGDILFFELPRWWPAADYLQLRGMDRGFPNAVLDAAHLGGISVWRVLASAMRERWKPSGDTTGAGQVNMLLSFDARKEGRGLASFQHPVFQAASGLPIGKLQQLQQLSYPVDYYEPLTFGTGPEPVRPLLSQPVVELALSIPTYVLTRGGQGRALVRKAFEAALPPDIVRRRSKGTTGQSVKHILLENLEFARSLLLDGELMRIGLIDRQRVSEALSTKPGATEIPAADVNTLVSVECWLRTWSQPRGSAHGVASTP